MREILFRGKDVYGNWLYGDLINLTDEIKQICNHTQLEHAHGVNPDTVGQYAGVVDMYGKKIFEGDVHYYNNCGKDYFFVVEHGAYTDAETEDDAYGWYMRKVETDECYALEGNESEYACIIGNVHDNPELARHPFDIQLYLGVKTVHIPSCDNHEGVYAIDVRLRWRCPVCGKPRGKITRGRSYDGSLCLDVDTWVNSCGHVDKYADVRHEAVANGLNIVTEVIPSDHGEGGDV